MARREISEEQLLHFMDHPEEVDATDTELVEALAHRELAAAGETRGDDEKTDDPDAEAARQAQAEADAKIAEAEAAEDAKAKADAEAKAKAAADKAKGTDTEGDAKGGNKEEGAILTQDGKHTLPYQVLKDERSARQAAETAMTEAQTTIVELTERVKALQAGRTDPGTKAAVKTADELEAMLEAVGKEYPGLDENLKTIVATVRGLQERVDEFDAEREETEEQSKSRLQGAANEALANNPTLVLWQSKAPKLFQEAVELDQTLRAGETYRGRFKSFDERFQHVVKLVKASHDGEEIPLPQAVAAAAPAAASTSSKTQQKPSAADLKRAGEALANARDETVRTLSDIPGGEGEVTVAEQLERMDVMDMADKFSRKTPQEILQWVQAGGGRIV